MVAPAHPLQPPAPQLSKDNQDVLEKYRKLEQKHQDSQAELRLFGERNVKLREERDLDNPAANTRARNSLRAQHPGPPLPPSSAFPRSPLSSRVRAAFVSNLRQAMAEDEAEDHNLDPLLSSLYIGQLARKRADEEHCEQLEDESRQARRPPKRSRATKGKEPIVPPIPTQPILTLSPSQHPESGTPPLLVSNKGPRLRRKPPLKPPTESDAGSSVNFRPPSPPPEEHSYQPAPYAENRPQPSVSAPPPATSPLSDNRRIPAIRYPTPYQAEVLEGAHCHLQEL